MMFNKEIHKIASIIDMKLFSYSSKIEYLKLCKRNIINSGKDVKEQVNAVIIIDMELRAYQLCINEIIELKNLICIRK